MTLQNRVLPTGDIVATPERGTLTGNRGHLAFDGAGRLGAPRWQTQRWICCTLDHPRQVYRGPAPARGWTPLFFLDEAVALTAGHRPCAYCRPESYALFKAIWDARYAEDIDRVLHRGRVTRGREQVRLTARCEALPDWSFVLIDGEPWLIHGGHLRRFTASGYTERRERAKGEVTVLTPKPILRVLAEGYLPRLHESL